MLILNGGDGTIHSALTYIINNKIFKKMPLIAILEVVNSCSTAQ